MNKQSIQSVIMVHTLQEAENYCNSFIAPMGKHRERTLDRMKTLMDLLGNPQKTVTVIHVGGSTGKSSTAYIIAVLLETTGLRVGLHIKPHLQKITERCCINRIPIPDDQFIAYVNAIQPYINTMIEKPTYFEILVAITLWYFAKNHVDVAVMEVGRGGRVDATNICSSKLYVLTNVTLMHTDILGKTLEDITKEKMGIVKHKNMKVITGVSQPKLRSYLQKLGRTLHIPITMVNITKHLTPLEQNQRLAIAAVKLFTSITESQIQQCLSTIQIPGRMEIWVVNGQTFIMDNGKTNKFLTLLPYRFPKKNMHVVLPAQLLLNTKALIKQTAPFTSEFIFVSFPERRPGKMDRALMEKSIQKKHRTFIDIEKFIRTYMNKPNEDVFLITGSLKLIGAIRTILKPSIELK